MNKKAKGLKEKQLINYQTFQAANILRKIRI